jgi:serine/threonine protein kinase
MQWQSIIGPGITARIESPWDTFRKYYDCDLAGPVAVCVRSSGDRGVWAARQYPIEDADKVLRNLRSMRHRNLASIRECFRTPEILYTLGDFDPLVLDHIVACKAFPDEQELAAIMSQVCSSSYLSARCKQADYVKLVDGLSYLAANNFHHTSLDCSSVLVNLNGHVKIGKFIPLLPPKSILPNKAR